MKKNLFMVAAVALVALISCNKETNSPLQPAPVSDIKFEAEFVNEQTKTSIGKPDENGYRKVTWDLGEEVYINGTLFTATDYKEDGKAIFVTEDLDFATAEQYNAIYPASAGETLAAVTIPAAQDGTFANAAIAVAQSENRSLAFMNVASLIKFQVESDCYTITITSNLNLTGKVSVTFDENGYPVLGSNVSEPSKTITLTGEFKAGQDYYVAALPGSHTFTVHIDSYLSKEGTKPVTLTRSNIVNLKAFPEPQESDYKIMGINGDWTNGLALYKDGDYYVRKNVALTESTEFKLCQGSVWGRPITLAEGKWAFTYDVDGNLKTTAGKYDIYVSAANDAVCFVTSGTAMPEYKSANKQLHLMLEKYEDCGLYMWQPSGTGLDNWDAAWNNYYGKVKMKQDANTWTEYYAFVVPSVAVDKSCKFLFKWYGGQSCDYTKTINTDLPFWRNGGNDGSYSFKSKIDIK